MNKKILRITLAIIGVILIIGVIAYFLLRSRDSEQTLTDADGQALSFIGNLPQSGNLDSAVSASEQPSIFGVGVGDPGFASQVIAEDLKKRSINFIERLGSYSSDSLLTNFDDVLPQTSAALELELRNLKNKRLLEYSSTELFVGYTVTAVTASADLNNLDNGNVEVIINAIREISGLHSLAAITDREIYKVGWILGEDGRWRVNGISGDF